MDRLVSPGVFTLENDLTFLPKGISEIGAAFIGPTLKGPAFRPVIVESPADFQRTFGLTSPNFYTPYAVMQYLSEASRATIVRVLGLSGYDSTLHKSYILKLSGSGGSAVLGLIHPSQVGVSLASVTATGTPFNFSLTISGSNGTHAFTSMSSDTTSPNYWAGVIGTSPATAYDGYAYATFPNAASQVATGSIAATLATVELNLSGSVYGAYSNANTPWITSQTISGNKHNLFRCWTLSDGNAANTDVKIAITNIRPSTIAGEYGTFSLQVRDFADTDNKLSILEQYDNLTLNPIDPNYVARRVGTSRTYIDPNGDVYLDGDFPNNSTYIYIDIADGLEQVSTTALPNGFAALNTPLNSANVPAPAYVTTRYYTPAGSSIAVANSKVYFGVDMNSDATLAYIAPLPSGSATQVGVNASGSADVGFDLTTSLAAQDIADLAPTTAVTLRRFIVPFQGGFDGMNPAQVYATGGNITGTNTQGFDLSESTKDGAIAYNMALTAISNPETFDINMLVTPGVIYSQHPYIVTQGITLCENRGDCFYILDGDVLGATTTSIINAVSGLNTNYAATYHPWIKVLDAGSNKTVWVPPAVVMPSVYAFSDRVSAEWYAPAGLSRGGIGQALQVRSRLGSSDRDVLYDARINPIASFPGQGIAAWGQKTLQVEASALDRVNVRRLLITVKKFIASAARYLVFEQNVEGTRNRFLSIVNPYLSNVAERNGLYAFKVVMDDSNNTPDVIDRNYLVGQLYLQPARSAEFIQLEFNILPTGATFPTA